MVASSLRQPRSAPSRRDQQIFYDVTVRGHLQKEVAEQHGLKQPRVSQIVNRVKRWRGGTTPLEAGEPAAVEQARLEHWTDIRLTEEIGAAAMREYRRSERTLTTKREGQRGEVAFSETTTREQAANVQHLKTALRCVEVRMKLRQEPQQPLPEEEEEKLWSQQWHQMQKVRLNAEQEGRVKPCNDVDALCDRLMNELYAVDPREEAPLQRWRLALVRPEGSKPKAEQAASKPQPGAYVPPAKAAGSANGANVEERVCESEMPPEVAAAIAAIPAPLRDYDPEPALSNGAGQDLQRLPELQKISAQVVAEATPAMPYWQVRAERARQREAAYQADQTARRRHHLNSMVPVVRDW